MVTTKSEIVTALNLGLCNITYKKTTGETRVAIGTLNPRYIDTLDKSPKRTSSDVVNYYDTGMKGWRSFNVSNVQTFSVQS